ncbi:amino acid transporter, putative [Cordyceps militaris CM01]|uniref:Amino acid transporter, putative n=2 Tax=Cordyceps militaris TaxID=73501 RepID=G3J641_CORMM|nr:amino acid transporter, putative [Cordyceps militaris CM01]ATY63580.1 Amino acid transmembrane [Cordyceps militaris]EGX96145.1 amino acid transporter, putative [Cordyceps militaris CM01]
MDAQRQDIGPAASQADGPAPEHKGKTDIEAAPRSPNHSMDDASSDAALINFKSLSWWKGGIILIAETVSLGILSLPSVVATLGLAPGIVLILVMSFLSTYSGLMLGEFQKEYPFVENFGDAVEVIGRTMGSVGLFGYNITFARIFQEVFGWAQVIFQVFVMGAHLLTWTICLNALSDHAACTIVWAVVGLAVFWVLNLPRTLRHTSWMSMASCISITVATLMTVGDVASSKPIGATTFQVSREIGFTSAFLAVTNIAVAFSSHSCFFGVIGEFEKPEDWPKALALLQIVDTSLYLIAAIVIYYYIGPGVPSPALSAAGSDTMRKAIWGVAIPTIVIAGVIYGHVAGKYVFNRMFKNSKHLVRRTFVSILGWSGMTLAMWAIALIIAESIPVFNSLLGILAALFVSWFSYGLPGIFWLWMRKGSWFSTRARTFAFVANVLLVVTGTMLCVLGLWASVEAIANEKGTKPWSCANNAPKSFDEIVRGAANESL